MEVEDILIELLERFNYPVIRQGSMDEKEEYPDTFITFWNNAEEEHSAYDNITTSVIYDFDVNTYSSDAAKAYDLLREVRICLKENGFIISGRGHDVASDTTTHTGRGMNVLYLKNEN